MIKQLDKINVSFILSNANNSFVSSTFNSFHVEKIQVKRRITPKKPDSLVFELVIHNINNQEKKIMTQNGYPKLKIKFVTMELIKKSKEV